jgi:hypothetical protein
LVKDTQAQSKISKVQEGFECGIYSVDEARSRISGHQVSVTKAEREIQRLEEKLALVSKLGIKVYPAEDLRSMRVICQLDLRVVQLRDESGSAISSESKAGRKGEPTNECGKVMFGSAYRICQPLYQTVILGSN